MLYAWMGFLKDPANPVPQSVQEQTSDFLGQPFIPIHSVGPLLDPEGNRAGMLMIFETENRDAADTFVKGSPYLKAGLYEDHRLYEYQSEVG